MSRTAKTNAPEKIAERLLKSAKNSCDPEVDLDWQAPLPASQPRLPFRRSSLYGTRLGERLAEQQRVELTKHEFGPELPGNAALVR